MTAVLPGRTAMATRTVGMNGRASALLSSQLVKSPANIRLISSFNKQVAILSKPVTTQRHESNPLLNLSYSITSYSSISRISDSKRTFSTFRALQDEHNTGEDLRKKRLARLRKRMLQASSKSDVNKRAPREEEVHSSNKENKIFDEDDADVQQPKWYQERQSSSDTNQNKSRSDENKENEEDTQKKNKGQPMPPGFDFNSKNFRVFEIKITPQHILIGLLVTFIFMSLASQGSMNTNEISWQEFQREYLDKGAVRKLTVVNKSTVYVNTGFGSSVYFTIGSIDLFEKRMEEAQKGVPPNERIPINYIEQGSLLSTLFSFLPTLLLLGAMFWMTRKPSGGQGGFGGGLFGMGQSKAKLYNKATDVNVKFADVAGMDEAKEEIMEFVKFLKEPAKYEELGAKIPRGAILSGPPGTGKTLLAKATAGEANVPFFTVSGSEFIEMFAGVGASRVRDLFKAARAKAPSIIFIDEIDAIGKARNKGFVSGGHDEREATLNQLLVEMDGFESSDHVVVLAGTNRADVLDAALLRPGRFDRHITIDRPDIEGRISIYNVHLKKIKYNKDIPQLSGKLAAMTPGFSGADIANVVNEAALIAARQESDVVELVHFEQAIERVIAGLEKKTKVLVPEKKKIVAYHEAGHAVCGWFLKFADPLVKVSIIPRGSAALGYAQYLPPDQYLISEEQFKDKMAMSLGGRVSEELNFPSVTLGGSDDFNKVTQMAKAMVTQLGMSPKVGQVFYEQNQESIAKPYSENTGEIIDSEIRRIVNEAHERCRELLIEKQAEVKLVAEELLTKEVITREDMIRLLGPRPFPERNDAFDKYLSDTPDKKSPTEDSSSPSPA